MSETHYTVLLEDDREGTLTVRLTDEGIVADLTTDDGGEQQLLGSFWATAQQITEDYLH